VNPDQTEQVRVAPVAESERRSHYLPALDGWRAIAIVAVLFDHADLLSVGRYNDRWLNEYGGRGVDVFFAISGLLICWRMLQEDRMSGRISLRNFYIRRGFRILPPALAFLVVLAVLHLMHIVPLQKMEWLSALFFFRNYSSLMGGLNHLPYFTGHFWSLAVEEHFYLLLPGLLVLTPKRFRAWVLAFLVAVIVAHRYVAMLHRPYGLIALHTDIRLDALLFPAMLAVLTQIPSVRARFQRYLRWWPALALVMLLLMPVQDQSFWKTCVVPVGFSFMVLGSILNPANALGRLLESAPFRFVGRISYSLYLWQQLFFAGHYDDTVHPFGWFSHFPLQFVAVFACAIASYYLLERPLVRLGHRMAPSPQPGREAVAPQVATT